MSESVSGMKHPALRDALALTRTGGRVASGRYLVEDLKRVEQALRAEEPVFAAFATEEAARTLEPLCHARSVPLYILSGGLLQKLVGTGYETASGAVAVVKQNRVAPTGLLGSESLILCGERIQDPRNVGVLIRTADAIGASGLLLTDDSAEPWQRQAVRSTTGSILRLPLSLTHDLPAALFELKRRGARVVGSSGGVVSEAASCDLARRPLVLVVGNEQSGLSDGVQAICDEVVRLPMAAQTGADSYNVTVAAGMLVYEAYRQKTVVQ